MRILYIGILYTEWFTKIAYPYFLFNNAFLKILNFGIFIYTQSFPIINYLNFK